MADRPNTYITALLGKRRDSLLIQIRLSTSNPLPFNMSSPESQISVLDEDMDNTDSSSSRAFYKLTSFERFFLEASPVFSQLLQMKATFRQDPAIDEMFASRRERQIDGRDRPSHTYRHTYERTMQIISNLHGDGFADNRVTRFLDLGCSPGGFSNWLLENNRDATGMGITLPDEEAPFRFDLDGTRLLEPRYTLLYQDIIKLAMPAALEGGNPLSSAAGTASGASTVCATAALYDLVIAGAFPTLETYVPWWYRVRLTLCQILIAFTNLGPGGTCVVLVKNKPFRWLVELLSLLRASFREVTAAKGSHRVRTSSYLVCTGFCATGKELDVTVGKFRSALQRLHSFSVEGAPQKVNDEDGWHNERSSALLDESSDEELLAREREPFLFVFEPQWTEQMDAMQQHLEYRTFSSSGVYHS